MSNHEASYSDYDDLTQGYSYSYDNYSYAYPAYPDPDYADPLYTSASGSSTGSKDSGYVSPHFHEESR